MHNHAPTCAGPQSAQRTRTPTIGPGLLLLLSLLSLAGASTATDAPGPACDPDNDLLPSSRDDPFLGAAQDRSVPRAPPHASDGGPHGNATTSQRNLFPFCLELLQLLRADPQRGPGLPALQAKLQRLQYLQRAVNILDLDLNQLRNEQQADKRAWQPFVVLGLREEEQQTMDSSSGRSEQGTNASSAPPPAPWCLPSASSSGGGRRPCYRQEVLRHGDDARLTAEVEARMQQGKEELDALEADVAAQMRELEAFVRKAPLAGLQAGGGAGVQDGSNNAGASSPLMLVQASGNTSSGNATAAATPAVPPGSPLPPAPTALTSSPNASSSLNRTSPPLDLRRYLLLLKPCLLAHLRPAHYVSEPPLPTVSLLLPRTPGRARPLPDVVQPLLGCAAGAGGAPEVDLELLVMVDSDGSDGNAKEEEKEAELWAQAAAGSGGRVVPVFGHQQGDVRAYNRLAGLARGEVLVLLHVSAVAAGGGMWVMCLGWGL